MLDSPQSYENKNVPHVPPSHEVPPLVDECNQPYENECQICRREDMILETSYEATQYESQNLEVHYEKSSNNPA